MTRKLLRLSLALALVTLMAAPALADGDHDHDGGRVVVAPGLAWGGVPWSPYYWDGWYGPYWGAGSWYGRPWWGPGWYPYGHVVVQPSADAAMVELHVRPSKAEVTVDGAVVGRARDFNGAYNPLWLKPGDHVLEITYPGFKTLKTHVDAGGGLVFNLHYRLERGEGLDPRSSAAPTAAG